MSNEELLGRIDERLTSASRQLESIHTQTTSIDKRLRDVEAGLKTLQSEVEEIPNIREELDTVVTWKDQLGGSWKTIGAISIVLAFVINGIIQLFTRD